MPTENVVKRDKETLFIKKLCMVGEDLINIVLGTKVTKIRERGILRKRNDERSVLSSKGRWEVHLDHMLSEFSGV